MSADRFPDPTGRRAFIKAAVAGAVGLSVATPFGAEVAPPEILYNGIRLANPWPPRLRSFSGEPVIPPYLVNPPAIVPIDLGRQLFVDDFLIEATTLTRTFHQARYHPRSPLLRPMTQWEKLDATAERLKLIQSPAAMVFSDGVFFDPADGIYKMWYMGGYTGHTCYATSADGFEWTRPMLDVVPGTNIVSDVSPRDSNTVWLDLDAADRARRYKMASFKEHTLLLSSSPDGIHWRHEAETGRTGDRSTIFYNPFRKKWVYSLREEQFGGAGRCRRYREHDNLFLGARWREEDTALWVRADAADPPRADYGVKPQLYNLDAVAYESVMLGLFSIWRGEMNDREKPNDLCIGFSRDGFHWDRAERRAFVPVSEHVGDWNWANIQSAGGCCLVVGDELHFYVSGRSGVPGTSVAGTCSTGLATLRRDGFASMDVSVGSAVPRRLVPGMASGMLLTRPVRFTGEHCFVNADLGDGELRVAVEDLSGHTIPGYELDACVPVRGNGTKVAVRWTSGTLAHVAGQPVRLRFKLTAGRLYAFWVSASASGASGGYVAAGGPGFKATRDV